MKERQKIEVPKDNYGRLYIGLLESPLTSTAKLCYGVMWSFGYESWASSDSIAKRMGMHRNSVGPAQAELEKAGWIELLESKAGTPKHWVMKTPTTNGQVGAQPLGSTCTTIVQPPAQPLGSKQEGKQELKQELKQAPAAKGRHPEQKAFWEKADALFRTKYAGEKLQWVTLSSFPKKLYEALETYGAEGLYMRWVNFLDDKFTLPDLMKFVCSPNNWIQPRNAGGPARAFVQPVSDWKPSGVSLGGDYSDKKGTA